MGRRDEVGRRLGISGGGGVRRRCGGVGKGWGPQEVGSGWEEREELGQGGEEVRWGGVGEEVGWEFPPCPSRAQS